MNERIEFIKKQPAFANLNSEEIEIVSQNLETCHYEPGCYVMEEEENSQDLYFIKEGEVEVVKRNKQTHEEFIIGTLRQGHIIGEMSFIDRQPRSTSVRVINKKTSIYKLPVNWSDPHLSSIYNKILEKVVQISMLRLREINKDYTRNLKNQVKEVKDQNQFGYFFIFSVLIYTINSLAKALLPFNLSQISFIALVGFASCLFFPGVGFIRYYMSGHSFADFGLTFQGARQTLKETFYLLAGGMLLLGSIYSYQFGWASFLQYLSQEYLFFFTGKALAIFYYIFSLEFVIRGTIQTALQKFLNGKNIVAILLIATLIWPINLSLGLKISFLKFLLDIFLGYLFIRQKNLIGVTLIHYFIAIFSTRLI